MLKPMLKPTLTPTPTLTKYMTICISSILPMLYRIELSPYKECELSSGLPHRQSDTHMGLSNHLPKQLYITIVIVVNIT